MRLKTINFHLGFIKFHTFYVESLNYWWISHKSHRRLVLMKLFELWKRVNSIKNLPLKLILNLVRSVFFFPFKFWFILWLTPLSIFQLGFFFGFCGLSLIRIDVIFWFLCHIGLYVLIIFICWSVGSLNLSSCFCWCKSSEFKALSFFLFGFLS